MSVEEDDGETYRALDDSEGFEGGAEAYIVVGFLEGDNVGHNLPGDDGCEVAGDGEEGVEAFGLGHGSDIIGALCKII